MGSSEVVSVSSAVSVAPSMRASQWARRASVSTVS